VDFVERERETPAGWSTGHSDTAVSGSFLHPLRGVITPNFRTTPPGFVS